MSSNVWRTQLLFGNEQRNLGREMKLTEQTISSPSFRENWPSGTGKAATRASRRPQIGENSTGQQRSRSRHQRADVVPNESERICTNCICSERRSWRTSDYKFTFAFSNLNHILLSAKSNQLLQRRASLPPDKNPATPKGMKELGDGGLNKFWGCVINEHWARKIKEIPERYFGPQA